MQTLTETLTETAKKPALLVLDSQRSLTPKRTALPSRLCPNPRQVWIPASQTVDSEPLGFQFVTVPCKTWGCPVCGPRKSRELARVLTLDARADPPGYAITLTTHDPDAPPEEYRHGSRMVWQRLRRLYGLVAYFGFMEFTTGYAQRAGGRRRLHGHYLVKFRDVVPDVIEVERKVRETWELVTGAYIVEVAQLITPGAAMAYLSLHHQKPQQAPPEGWRGMRSRPSKGYFSEPMWKLRARAKRELAIEAIAWANGISEIEAALVYEFPTIHALMGDGSDD